VEFLAVFEVFPEVTLKDFSKIKVTRPVADVSDKDVKKMIEQLRNQQAKFNKSKKKATSGDQVNIDYVGTRDGEAFDGGSADGQDLILGSNSMIPGFEKGLEGLTGGEETILSLTFPDDYQSEDLQGASVEFAVKINQVSAKKLPKMDDEFFKLFGVEEGGEERFREEVQGNMERELRNATRTKIKNRLMNELFDQNPVELPSALIDNEIAQLKRQMVQQFGGGQDIDLDMLPNEMFQDKAERRAALGVIVSEIVKVEGLVPDEEQVRERVDEIASTYEQPKEVVDYYYSKPEMLSSVEALVLEDQVTELVLSKAKVKDKKEPYEEVIKPDPEPGTEK
jgi:trigger factor